MMLFGEAFWDESVVVKSCWFLGPPERMECEEEVGTSVHVKTPLLDLIEHI